MTRLYDEWQIERARKQEALLDVPDALDTALSLIGELQEDVRRANEQIEALHKSAREREAPRLRLLDSI